MPRTWTTPSPSPPAFPAPARGQSKCGRSSSCRDCRKGNLRKDMPMQSDPPRAAGSKGAFWTGWVLSALPALFLLFDGAMKLVKPTFVVEGTVRLGYVENVIVPLGVVLLVSTVLYLVPRTAVLGAILLTGYLGGAVA